jgi:hypothetical protein
VREDRPLAQTAQYQKTLLTDACGQEAWGVEQFLWRWELGRKCFPFDYSPS